MTPLEDLHAPHRAADQRVPSTDAEMIGETCLARTMSRTVMTGNRTVRRPIHRRCRRRPGGSLTATENVDAHTNQRLVPPACLGPRSRPTIPASDACAPPDRRRGTPVQAWHSNTALAASASSLAPGLVGHRDVAQGLAAVEGKATVDGEREEAALSRVVTGLPRPRRWHRLVAHGHSFSSLRCHGHTSGRMPLPACRPHLANRRRHLGALTRLPGRRIGPLEMLKNDSKRSAAHRDRMSERADPQLGFTARLPCEGCESWWWAPVGSARRS